MTFTGVAALAPAVVWAEVVVVAVGKAVAAAVVWAMAVAAAGAAAGVVVAAVAPTGVGAMVVAGEMAGAPTGVGAGGVRNEKHRRKIMRTAVVKTKETNLILTFFGDEPRIDSRVVAKGLDVDHRSTIRLIKRHQYHFEDFGQVRFEITVGKRKQGGGNPESFILLNENQSIFLLTLSKNSEQVVLLKKKLTREFDKYRRQAIRKAERDWQQLRFEGKVIRRQETDMIKRFVEYATGQGSKNAQKYFITLTNMTNKALFIVEQGIGKPGHFRDLLDCDQHSYLQTAEIICRKALEFGMNEGMYYKDIYQLAKQRVEAFAATVGKTPLLPEQKLLFDG